MTTGRAAGRPDQAERAALIARIVGVPDESWNGRVELRQLRYFVAVAEELHFGRAAARLQLAQPALSQSIIGLERAIGVQLLRRTTRTVELTAAGRVFLDECRRALLQVGTAVQSAQRAERGEAGLLRIGYVVSASYEILPPILVAFRRRHPGVGLQLMSRSATEQVTMVLHEELSVGFVREFQDTDELDSELLVDEPLVAVLPADHAAAHRSKARLSWLAEDSLLMFDRDRAPGMYDKVVSSCVDAGFTPRIVQQSSDVQSVLGLVAGGMGVTVVPASFRHLSIDGLVYRPLADVGTRIGLYAVWRKDGRTSVLDGFLDVAREHAGRVGRRASTSR